MSWLRGVIAKDETRDISSIDDYIAAVAEFTWNGITYYGGVETTLGGGGDERIGNDFVALVQGAYQANGVVFACMLARWSVFSAVRFRWQRLRDGKPSDMFGTPDLRLLERPWVGGTTQGLLTRMIQDADLAGNAFHVTHTPLARLGGDETSGKEIVRLRPDWVEIVTEPRMFRGGVMGHRKLGYVYTQDGLQSGNEPVPLLVDEVSHFAPTPDPLASFRGMSWLTPVIREIQGDRLMQRHKIRFFQNGATPNMIVKHPEKATEEKIKKFAAAMDENHQGVDQAYKNLHLYPGSDATVVGADFKQVDFTSVQGAGETRIASAAGVPPIIVGLTEGLETATYSNYGQARRRFADGTEHPLWQDGAGSLEPLMPPMGDDVRLWYDASDVPFLREDEKDAAEIAFLEAQTFRQLIDAGYEPESVQLAIASGDWRLLQHSGLYSVQLQKPGSQQAPTVAAPPAAITQGDDDGTDDDPA